MTMNEFGAVIRIDPAQAKGQRPSDLLERRLHTKLALAEHGPRLDTRGVNVGDIQRMEKFSVGAIAGMRHEVNFGEAGHLDISAVRLQRNLLFQ